MKNFGLLITGSTGIAAATARAAVQQGANVFIVGRDEESCHSLYQDLSTNHQTIGYFIADLTQEDKVTEAVHCARGTLGRLDAVFNVAGISGRRFGDGPAHECTLAGWEQTLDHNLKSTFLMCRTALQVMLTQPLDERGLRGAILNMGSVLAASPEPKHFATHAYAASKAAITGLSRSLAAYYAPQKIRVNVIAPSLVATPMSARAQSDAEILDYMKIKQPLGESMLTPQDIAQAALFLLSPAASRITGQVITVDAGWSVTNA